MTSRRSYRGLMALPAYGLYDAQGALVATVRAVDAVDARAVFRKHAQVYGLDGCHGARVRPVSA